MNFEIQSGPIDVAFFAPTKGRKPGTRNKTAEANLAAAKAGAALVRSSNVAILEAARMITKNSRLYIGNSRLARLISIELKNSIES